MNVRYVTDVYMNKYKNLFDGFPRTSCSYLTRSGLLVWLLLSLYADFMTPSVVSKYVLLLGSSSTISGERFTRDNKINTFVLFI